MLGGISGNNSARELVALGAVETARASYSSWFISPSIGVAIPVLQLEDGEVDLVGKVSYVGGNVSGYTETGSSLNLTVGNQSIGLLDARIGLAGTFDTDASGATKITANGGVLAQANVGGTSVPVSFLGQTQNAAVAGITDFGLYGGLGLSTQVSPSVKLSAGADAQWKFNGELSGAVRAGISASF